MTTTRSFQAPARLTLDVTTGAAPVAVIAEARDDIAIDVYTDDDTGPSADAVRLACFGVHFDRAVLQIEDRGSGGGVHVSGNRGIVIGQVIGSVVMTGNGNVIGDGNIMHGDFRGGGAVIRGGSPVRVLARVPEHASLAIRTASGDVDVSGTVGSVTANSASGGVRVDNPTRLNATTVSGGIHVRRLAGSARVRSTSGGVDVHAVTPGGDLDARTISGDIRTTGERLRMRASSTSGSVTNF